MFIMEKSNYAFKRTAELALGSNQPFAPQPLNAALGVAMNHFAIWNSFHDGVIERLTGLVPGDITFYVAIGYLRNRFSGSGSCFRVTLSECTKFEYEAYDEKSVNELAEIERLEPMVLSVETGEPLVVNCVMGTLRLAYGSASVETDSGHSVSAQELKEASCAYWAEWSAKHRGNT